MGNGSSRIDKFYGSYEKSFERLEADVERLKARAAARAQRKATLSWWTGAAVALTVAVSIGLVYQVQRQPHITYQQHFSRIGTALALPAAAFVLHWLLRLLSSWIQGRDSRKLKALEAAKRSMVKELKEMSRFDKIKSLIDKFDPDVRHIPPRAVMSGPLHHGQLASVSSSQQQRLRQQQGGQVSGLFMKGSGQVAGAAAHAVAGAGKAFMPLLDKFASTLISDNPVLLEDLRRAQAQVQNAEMCMYNAAQENYAVKMENFDLKQRLVALEKRLDLPPSYDIDVLQEQLQQQQESAQQQLPYIAQQYAPGTTNETGVVPQPSIKTRTPGSSADDGAPVGPNSWPGNGSGWAGDVDGVHMPHGALSVPQTPTGLEGLDGHTSGAGGVRGHKGEGEGGGGCLADSSMGEGLHAEQAPATDAGLRQRVVHQVE